MKKKLMVAAVVGVVVAVTLGWLSYNKEEIQNKATEKVAEAIIDTAVDKVADKAKEELESKVLDKLLP
tara:strand:+ start:1083 stop:1286 length:204 start_codon:yes stop_codon:yes gene_type:complete